LALAAGMHARQFFSRVSSRLREEFTPHRGAALLKHTVRTRAANGLACARRRRCRWAFWRWQFLWCAPTPAGQRGIVRVRGPVSHFMFRCHVTVNGSRCDQVASGLASSVAHPVRPRSQRKRLHPIISPRTPLSRRARATRTERTPSTHDACRSTAHFLYAPSASPDRKRP